jgi:hypothetical protein
MADKMRWRYGDTNPVMARPDADAAIEIGDLVYQEIGADGLGRVFPFDGVPRIQRQFLGVTMQRSAPENDSRIRVATSGTFDFDCPRDVWGLGKPVQAISAQEVSAAMDIDLAIGRVGREEEDPTDSVLVRIESRVYGPCAPISQLV